MRSPCVTDGAFQVVAAVACAPAVGLPSTRVRRWESVSNTHTHINVQTKISSRRVTICVCYPNQPTRFRDHLGFITEVVARVTFPCDMC
eukprot:337557-Pyramimonas_sp.AAC.1